MTTLQLGLKKPENAKTRFKKFSAHIYRHRALYLMLLPVIANFIIFHYIPMYGLQIAFKRYNIVHGMAASPWVGFRHFQSYFGSFYFWLTLRNTLLISLYSIVFGFPLPILFALMMNEIRVGKFKKISQTVSYLPNFISSVIVVGMVLQILSPSGGILNTAIQLLGGDSIYFMGSAQYFRRVFILMQIWRGTGFGAIIYIAAITSLDPEIYEAAVIDGCGRIKRMWHITLPGILPTITVILILRLGGILDVGWMEMLLLQNPMNTEVSEVIQTFVYKRGLIQANFSYGSAIGMFRNVIGLVFVLGANALARKYGETSLF